MTAHCPKCKTIRNLKREKSAVAVHIWLCKICSTHIATGGVEHGEVDE